MDNKSQELFDSLLKKDQDSLSADEVAFLMARRSYLNDADKKRYADLIKAHESGKKAKKGKKDEDEG